MVFEQEIESVKAETMPETPVESIKIEEKLQSYGDDFEGGEVAQSDLDTPVSSPRTSLPNFKEQIPLLKTPEKTPKASADEESIQDMEPNESTPTK